MRAIFSVLILIYSLSVQAWEVRDHYKDESKYNLLLRGGQISDLGKIIGEESRKLSGINLGRVIQLNSGSLQVEVQGYLSEHYPNELKAAYTSAGNMHNPKVKPLRKPFQEALLNCSYIKSIAKVLRDHNYEVVGVSTEKFMLINGKHFDAMVWLEIEQLTSKASRTPQAAPLL
ncbi:hypothetical protein [Pleionea litopenaei]|uniref:Uncharacterized protein n=1 Tax=Pleionea litopenaei TaxID=3070815 RepID=A0AA51RWN3_9GAMM|nr:hypothetical protein [Pleionea sp. HL-JVS1]WMS89026.1 hypothetical protein Q9312_08945 [Pleionea sp. HL-JVS1]